MTADRTARDRALTAWLVDGVDTAPPHAVRAALEQLDTTRQRRELALLRRVPFMDATAQSSGASRLQLGLLGAAGVALVLVGVAVVANLVMSSNGPAASPAPSRATMLVQDVSAPPGTARRDTVYGLGALAALSTRIQVPVFNQLPMQELSAEATAVGFDALGTGDQRSYIVAAMTFADADAASSALATIRSGFRMSMGQWAAANSPFTDEHLPAGIDEGFERSGTWLAFGGTSANAGNRVGHLNIWRADDVVFVVAGVDWTTVGTADYQSQVEAAVVEISQALMTNLR